VQVLGVLVNERSLFWTVLAGVHPLGRPGSHIRYIVAVNVFQPSPYVAGREVLGESLVAVGDAFVYGYELSRPLFGTGGEKNGPLELMY